MIGDQVRTGAYFKALRQTVQPGHVVVDLGCGPGIFSLLACKLGAARVYAIEWNDSIEVAKEIAAANGYGDRIEFIQEMSTRVVLPEPADVIVSEIHHILPLNSRSLSTIIDARQRLLAPGGALIPRCETLWAAVAEAPDLYRRYTAPWEENDFSFDLKVPRQMVTNLNRSSRVQPKQLLVEPQCWATLDYQTLKSPDVSGKISWTAARSGTAHGVSVWFEAVLADGVGLSTAPGQPELIFSRGFFPWSAPVDLKAGDRVGVSLKADLLGENYLWRWETRVLDRDNPKRVKAAFKQSNFFRKSSASLPKLAENHVPRLNEDGQLDRFILAKMDGAVSLGDLARQVMVQFPNRFATWYEALSRVGELSKKYSL